MYESFGFVRSAAGEQSIQLFIPDNIIGFDDRRKWHFKNKPLPIPRTLTNVYLSSRPARGLCGNTV
jgi:hypothetical protein